METTRALEGPEQFEAYRRAAEARLADWVKDRRAFLDEVVQRTAELLRQAEGVGHAELAAELQALLRHAERELADLPVLNGRDEVAPAPEPAPPAEPPPAAETPAAAANGAKAGPAAVAPAEAPAPEPAPAPAAPEAERPPPPAVPPPPAYSLRPVAEIDAELRQLEGQVDQGAWEGEGGLLRLKALLCRQRRAYWELEEQHAYSGEARILYGRVKALVQERFDDQYVFVLDTHQRVAEPPDWEELAQAYERLAVAWEAFAWFREREDALGAAEARGLLEGIAAAQQHLYRLLHRQLGSAPDDQQRWLFEALLELTDQRSLRLTALDPHIETARLAAEAQGLAATFQRMRGALAKKAAQRTAVERLVSLAGGEEFGTRDEDPAALREAALACLEAGVPYSNKQVRDALLPWVAFLEDEPRLEKVCGEIQKELERRERRRQAAAHEEEGEAAFSAEVQSLLDELLLETEGKRCVFIGGDPREEKRQELEAALRLEELVWPEARKAQSVYDFEPQIRRCDVAVLLIRFMRTGFNKAVELANRHGTRVVRLPAGYGLPRVISDMHAQLVPRSRET